MSDIQALLDKAVDLMEQHLGQIKRDSTYLTKDGAKGLTPTDAAVIERYTKLLLVMNKDGKDTDLDDLTDEELLAKLNESDSDVQDTASET